MEYYRNVEVERDETIDQARERELEDFPDIVGGHDIALPPRAPVAAVGADGDGTVEVELVEPEE
jgi:hypothetical protein